MKNPIPCTSFLALLFVTPSVHAVATDWQTNAHGQVRLISPYLVASKQGMIYFGLEFKTQKDWHVYWKNPGDAGYAPRLHWEGSRGFHDPELLYPAPNYYSLPGDLIAIGYTGEVIYPIRAHVDNSSDRIHAVLDLDYLTCNEACVPYRYKFTLDIPTGAQAQMDPEMNSLIAPYETLVPLPSASRKDLPIVSGLYQRGKTLFFSATLPNGTFPDAHKVNVFFDLHPQLAFQKQIGIAQPDGSWRLEVPVQVKDGQTTPSSARIAFTLTGLGSAGSPVSIEENRIYHVQPAPPDIRIHATGGDTPVAPQAAVLALPLAVFFGFLGGLILNVMPCVLPVLSIKLFGLLQHSGESRQVIVRDALASAAGIVVSFLIGGGLAILARETGMAVGWGIQFQDPRFVAFLAVIVTLFAMNLWGVFEINLPPALAQWMTTGQDEEGAVSYFVSGMFATLLATPCSAPFLGTAMGFGLSQPASTTLVIFTAAGFGMALPYLLLAAVPQTLHWLPKPGSWMLHVKYILGLFLAATVFWLGWVISSQVDHTGVLLFYLGLIVVGLLVWAKRVLGQLQQPQWAVWVGLLMLLFGMVKGIPAHRKLPVMTPMAQEGPLSWEAFDAQKISGYLQAGKYVFVDVTADWCFTCKYNEKVVLNSATVIQAFQQQGIVLMKADWTNRDAAIGDYLKSFHRYGIPFYAYYQPGKDPVVLSEFLTQKRVLKVVGK